MQAVTIPMQHRKSKKWVWILLKILQVQNFADMIDFINDWRVPFLGHVQWSGEVPWCRVNSYSVEVPRIPPCPLVKVR